MSRALILDCVMQEGRSGYSAVEKKGGSRETWLKVVKMEVGVKIISKLPQLIGHCERAKTPRCQDQSQCRPGPTFAPACAVDKRF